MAGDPQALRVAVHPCDEGGCLGGHYRIIWPAEVLASDGHDVTIETHSGERVLGPGGALVDVQTDADVVVFQRPMARAVADMIPVLQAHGRAVVVEIDDDFTALPRGHGARKGTSVANDPDHNRRWLRVACERADLVTVTTPALAQRYGAHGRVVVLPNLVPESYLAIDARKRTRPRVGWTGSTVTHVGDLDVCADGLRSALNETGARFVGLPSAISELGLADAEAMEWKELTGAYPHFVAGWDVGIVPLADNAFCHAKSALKGAEYAALGVPFVASPRDDYVRLHRDYGVGILAETPEEWRTHLTALLASPERRADEAGRNREAMRPLTYEQNADMWMAAWCSAAEHRVKGLAA